MTPNGGGRTGFPVSGPATSQALADRSVPGKHYPHQEEEQLHRKIENCGTLQPPSRADEQEILACDDGQGFRQQPKRDIWVPSGEQDDATSNERRIHQEEHEPKRTRACLWRWNGGTAAVRRGVRSFCHSALVRIHPGANHSTPRALGVSSRCSDLSGTECSVSTVASKNHRVPNWRSPTRRRGFVVCLRSGAGASGGARAPRRAGGLGGITYPSSFARGRARRGPSEESLR